MEIRIPIARGKNIPPPAFSRLDFQLAALVMRWSEMSVDPLTFGAFQSVTFEMDVRPEPNLRPVSSLEVDDSGRIFAASASDPDVDGGPFRSMVWEIGSLEVGPDSSPTIWLRRPARRLATLDGLKVEAIAVRPIDNEAIELFVGTDDEHYGGVVRPLPEALQISDGRDMRSDQKESPEK